MINTRTLFLTIFSLLLCLPLAVSAFEVRTDPSIYVAKDEIIEGNLYAVGNIITVDGTVRGDVICAGQSININGTVEGDVICAGQSLYLNGIIDGSARLVGNSVNINSEIKRGAQTVGASVILGADAQIAKDLLLAAATGDIRGSVTGDLHGAAGHVLLDGAIGGDVRLRLNSKIKNGQSGLSFQADGPLEVTKNAQVGGNLFYTAGVEGTIEEGADIGGEVGHSYARRVEAEANLARAWLWGSLFSVFSTLIVGLALVSLFGETVKKITATMRNKVGLSIGIGALSMFLFPIIFLLLALTLIGIPLGFMLLALWLISLYLGKLLTAIVLGDYLLHKTFKAKKYSLTWSMALGVLGAWLLFSIPIVGWLLSLVAIWWGAGALWLHLRALYIKH